MDEPPRERQENELNVLQAIYLKDFVLLPCPKAGAGKEDEADEEDEDEEDGSSSSAEPPLQIADLSPDELIRFRLHLLPQVSNNATEVHANVDLEVVFPEAYPLCPPKLALVKAKGVPKDDLATKENALAVAAQSSLNQEMIFLLVQDVQSWLLEYNHPQLSFYEQMMASQESRQKKEAEERERLLRQEQEENQRRSAYERQQIQDTLDRRQEEYKQLKRQPCPPSPEKMDRKVVINSVVKKVVFDRDDSDSPSVSPSPNSSPKVLRSAMRHPMHPVIQIIQPSSLAFGPANVTVAQPTKDQPTSEDGLRATTLGSFDITVGKCLGRSSTLGCSVHAAMTSLGELTCLSRWHMLCRSAKKQESMGFPPGVARRLKQVVSIETEFITLQSLSHSNLVHYQGMRHWQERDTIHVEVMKEYVNGGSLADHLVDMADNIFLNELLHTCTKQLLEAIAYLHSNGFVHKDLQLSSVFLDRFGKVRVADFTIMKRIGDLNRSLSGAEEAAAAVTLQPHRYLGIGKKGDIFRMGLLLLALSQGDASYEYTGTVPDNISPSFKDFVDRCLHKDEKLRPSARELTEHPYIAETKADRQLYVHRSGMPSPPSSIGSPGVLNDPIALFGQNQRSRLLSEFTIEKQLGQGGFGDVIKVLNKLDGCLYAIKRIPLRQRAVQFNSKIVREVKLLSRLNHENVVRYYNSWIEYPGVNEYPFKENADGEVTEYGEEYSDSGNSHEPSRLSVGSNASSVHGMSSDNSSTTSANRSLDGSFRSMDSPGLFDMSFGNEDGCGDDDDDDDDGGIVFASGEPSSVTEEDEYDDGEEERRASEPQQFLYIQMEYCERSTLRDVIDTQMLYKDEDRVWRLFRELVDGISHIHEQAMIHRDLKPLNVFLDSNDHIKIGDFGLATTHSHSMRQNSFISPAISQSGLSSPISDETSSSSLTSRVGTALYISPELLKNPRYTQKVDIYSLGIIFFEMCHPSLATGMERMKVISGLRSEVIVFPADFEVEAREKQCKLIRWMLDHNPHQRPSARELLDSDYLPLTMENREMNEVLRCALASTNSTRYRDLMTSLFSQPVDSVVDFTYDLDLHKGSITPSSALYRTNVLDRLAKIFRRHGAVFVDTPQLTPLTSTALQSDSVVYLMDRHGGLVAMQHDLRASFARLVSRNGIQHMKRYMIGKVFRDKKVRGAHPLEIYECAFDIVTPTSGALLADAEVIYSVTEVIQEFDHLQACGYAIHLNHTSLAQALLRHCSVPLEHYAAVSSIFHEISVARIRWAAAQTRLLQLSISELAIRELQQFSFPMDVERAKERLEPLHRDKGGTAMLTAEGLHELEAVISHLQTLGVKLQIVIDLGVMPNVHSYYSGVMFRIQVANTLRRARNCLAVGGRYDKLLSSLAPPSEEGGAGLSMSAVGVSLAVDNIVNGLVQHGKDESVPGLCEALVAYVGHGTLLQERISVVRDMWQAGINADIYQVKETPSVEELQDYCRSMHIPHLILLKDRSLMELGTIKVRTFEKERQVIDKMVPVSDLVDYILSKRDTYDASNPSRVSQFSVGSEGASSSLGSSGASGGVPPVNITIVTEHGKLPTHIKRKYQSQALVKVTPLAHKLGLRPPMELLAVELPKAVLQQMRSGLDLSLDEDEFNDRVMQVNNLLSKYRKYVARICDHIHDLVYGKKISVIFLYSCKDEFCEVIF